MARKLPPLQRLEGAQAQASHPSARVWLSASAGTGKTHVLVARVLRLLLSGVDPRAILCLTFTKAGAAEMAERVHRRLAGWVRMKPADLRKELWALGEPTDDDALGRARTLFATVIEAGGGGLRIQTIHAFCQTLLASFPVEADLAPGFRPIEGREASQLGRHVLGELLVEAEAGGRLGLIDDVQCLSRRLGEQKAEAYLVRCARDPDAMAALGPGVEARVRRALDLPAGEVETLIRELCADDAFDCEALRRIERANRGWDARQGRDHAERAAAFLAATPEVRASLLDGLGELRFTKAGELRKLSAKLIAAAPDYERLCDDLGQTCRELLSLRARDALAKLIAAGLRAGQAFAQAYAGAKRRAGLVDFEDLIRRTVALLETPGMGDWVRYKLDRRFDHVLVDEAQDTNAKQWSIVAALAGEFLAGAGAKGQRSRTIFTVGDYKQAIFGFQGTDPQEFEAARTAFARQASEEQPILSLSLDRSFRSTPPVLELVDRVIEEIGGEALGLDAAPERHRSARPGPGAVTLLRPFSAGTQPEAEEGAEEGWVDDATLGYARQLARQIAAWLAEPLRLRTGEPLKPQDIMVLVRRRGTLASLLVARLHAEGVPVAGVDRLRLDAPLAVRDLLAALRFAVQPEDDLTLANLLVSPLFGWSQARLFDAAYDRTGSLRATLRPRGEGAAADALDAILRAADFTTPYRLLEDMLSGPLDGRRKLLARLGPEARDPIDELLSAALTFEQDTTPSLQRFLDWFDRGEVEIVRDPSAPLDAVRVMTVHGAKGLQAPLVILADATGDPELARAGTLDWRVEDDLVAVPVPRPRKDEMADAIVGQAERAARSERQEHWRLLYVALTRAEERLVIGGALTPRMKGEPPGESWYAAVERAMAGLGADWSEDALWSGARHFLGITPAAATGGGRAASPRRTTPMPVPALPAWARRPAPGERRPPRPLAPSSLGADRVADPPPPPALRAAAERGRLLHALFERLPAVPPDRRMAEGARWLAGQSLLPAQPELVEGPDDAARNVLRQAQGERGKPVRQCALSPTEIEALLADACGIIADPRFAELFGPDSLAEAPIAAVVDGEVIAGTIDRLLVGADSVRLIDFKTNRRPPRDLGEVPEHHLRQMGAYAAALGAIFPGRRVAAALLYTAGPILIDLPPAALAGWKRSLGGTEQKQAQGG